MPLLGRLISKLGAFPVNRGKNDVAAVKTTISLLKGGEAVGLFPQGTRHPGEDPRGTKVLGGVAMIAAHAGVPVVPTLILTKKMKVRAFCRTVVVFGKPVMPEEIAALSGEGGTGYRAAAEAIFRRVTDLIPEGWTPGTPPVLPSPGTEPKE